LASADLISCRRHIGKWWLGPQVGDLDPNGTCGYVRQVFIVRKTSESRKGNHCLKGWLMLLLSFNKRLVTSITVCSIVCKGACLRV
jgi:hypothetical protein